MKPRKWAQISRLALRRQRLQHREACKWSLLWDCVRINWHSYWWDQNRIVRTLALRARGERRQTPGWGSRCDFAVGASRNKRGLADENGWEHWSRGHFSMKCWSLQYARRDNRAFYVDTKEAKLPWQISSRSLPCAPHPEMQRENKRKKVFMGFTHGFRSQFNE